MEGLNGLERMQTDSDFFHIMIVYPHQYKEIVMVRAVDIETVIANAGGYIGLFLGKAKFSP